MNSLSKTLLTGLIGFAALEAYKLYKLSKQISITPVGFSFNQGKLSVKLALNNPVDISLSMRGVDGEIVYNKQIVSTFISGPFKISPGISYITMIFSFDPSLIASGLINMIVSPTTQNMVLLVRKKLPLISMTDSYSIDPKAISA